MAVTKINVGEYGSASLHTFDNGECAIALKMTSRGKVSWYSAKRIRELVDSMADDPDEWHKLADNCEIAEENNMEFKFGERAEEEKKEPKRRTRSTSSSRSKTRTRSKSKGDLEVETTEKPKTTRRKSKKEQAQEFAELL